MTLVAILVVVAFLGGKRVIAKCYARKVNTALKP